MKIKIAVHSFFEEFARTLSMKEMAKVIQLVWKESARQTLLVPATIHDHSI